MDLDLVVCPHCCERVLLSSDRTCARCRRAIHGESPFVPVVVRTATSLPARRVLCDLPAPTWRVGELGHAARGSTDDPPLAFLAVELGHAPQLAVGRAGARRPA